MTKKHPITVAYGDGIGPEIYEATLDILEKAGAQLDIETVDIGEKVYLAGSSTGIEDEAWESLFRTKVFFKISITTPRVEDIEVSRNDSKSPRSLRKCPPLRLLCSFYSNETPIMDVVIIRGKCGRSYTGIEYAKLRCLPRSEIDQPYREAKESSVMALSNARRYERRRLLASLKTIF